MKKENIKSPLSALASMDFANFETNHQKTDDNIKNNSSNEVIYVDPEIICNWTFHDRPCNELGDLDSLAKEFLDPSIGQKQPCIVRPIEHKKYKYEVIAGERRWRASKIAGVKLAVIVQEMNDTQAAYCQIAENHNRKALSDFALGMSFAQLINNNFLKQKDLQDKFNLTAVQINRLLSFSQLPEKLTTAIGDLSKVSARTAAEIRSLLKKDKRNEQAIIELAPKIRTGKLGEKLLKKELEKIIDKNFSPKISARKFVDSEKKLVFNVKESSNKINIEIPRDKTSNRDINSLYEMIMEYLCK